MSKNRALILATLAVVSIMLFNAPLLSIFNRFGVSSALPALYLYLFGAWAGVIFIVFWIVSGAPTNANDDE